MNSSATLDSNVSHSTSPSEALISLEHISKKFPGVLALDNVTLTLNKGEVHCLAGQNGCGKSTIIKFISCVYQPEKGAAIMLDGKLFNSLTPQLSSYYGIQVIYQDLSLFPNLSVAENIAIHRYLPGGDFWVHKDAMRQKALAAMKRGGVALDPDRKVEKLSIADRQLVAICRAIAADASLVIMDEPTASLTRTEVNGLLRVVNELKAANICVVFVSHRLDEVMEVADRISVMRDGKLVGTYPASELDSNELAFLMTGQRFSYSHLPQRAPAEVTPLLEVSHLTRAGQYQDISLSLRQGEITSIIGLLGSGRTELCLSLFGMTKPDSGEIRINGKAVSFRSNRDAIRNGIAYVSEDRLTQGLIMEQSIYDNTLVSIFNKLQKPSGLMNHRKAKSVVKDLIRDLNIKVSDSALPVKTLSGGNAQRIAIAKWVATEPHILILDSPTVGVDIANKEGIYRIARDLAESGMAVLMICDEIPEAYYNSHRVLVMRKGELVVEFSPHQCSEAQIAEVINA